jgi:polyhydroxybutyrate depolymerase
VRLPAGYDPTRAYPTAIVGAGCGGKGDNVIPIYEASGPDAIIVGLSPSFEVAGRDCFMTESPESKEIDFFDAVLAAMKQGYCIDESRVYIAGFSSGSWLTNLLGCARGSQIRAQGNAAGGPPPLPDCTGPIAAIMVHDVNDGSNEIPLGRQTRDRLRDLNGCTDATLPWDAEFPECVAYQGCMESYPLVWCETTGKGHSDNVPISTEGFWKFWSSQPPLAPSAP